MAADPTSRRQFTRRALLVVSGALALVGVRRAGAAPVPVGPGRERARPDQSSAGRQFTVDAVVGSPVIIPAAGSGPPQRGDWFFVDAAVYESGKTDKQQIGVYQCFGAWTAAGADMSAPNQRFTTVQFHLDGVGAIMGLINEAGTVGNDHIGAVQGGTGAFAGASGTFRQEVLSGGVVGVSSGQTVFRAHFDLS